MCQCSAVISCVTTQLLIRAAHTFTPMLIKNRRASTDPTLAAASSGWQGRRDLSSRDIMLWCAGLEWWMLAPLITRAWIASVFTLAIAHSSGVVLCLHSLFTSAPCAHDRQQRKHKTSGIRTVKKTSICRYIHTNIRMHTNTNTPHTCMHTLSLSHTHTQPFYSQTLYILIHLLLRSVTSRVHSVQGMRHSAVE